MDALSEREKEAILSEIQLIKKALSGDKDDSDESHGLSSEENSDGPYVDEEEEQELDDFSFLKAKSSSAWQAFYDADNYDDDDDDNNDNDDEYTSVVLQKAQAVIQQSNAHEAPTFHLGSGEPFIKMQTSSVENGDLSAKLKEKDVSICDSSKDGNSLAGTNLTNDGTPNTGEIDIGSLEWALQLNRDYQEIVTEELMRIDIAIRNNKAMQAEVESRSTVSKNPNLLGYSFFAKFRPTYFKDFFGQGPPENEDSKKRDALKAVHPFIKPQKAWKEVERQQLAEGVRNQNLERMTLELKQKLNELKKKEKDDDSIRLKTEINEVEKEMENLKNIPHEDLEMSLDDLDFLSISRLYLPERTEKECRVRWLNLEHPAINHSKWTKEEDNELLNLSKKYNQRHWEKIAQELGTHRTPVQCCQRFQRNLNKNRSKSPWTEEEDKQLLEAVEVCTKGNWVQVCSMVEGKTPMQCMFRYKCLKPGTKKGPWSKEENELLLKYAEIYGPGKWKKISEHIPGRSDSAVRERWVNNYDPSLKLRRKWSKKEDILLLQAVDKHGIGRWTKVADDVPGRTDNMCWRRWKNIQKDESLKYYKQRVRKKKKEVKSISKKQDLAQYDSETGSQRSGWKPRAYRKRPGDGVDEEETGREAIEEGSKSDRETSNEEEDSDTTVNEREKIVVDEEDDGDSIDDVDANEKRESGDPDYQPDETFVSDRQWDEGIQFNDSENQTFFDDGERIVGRYDAGIISYLDAKRELCMLKSRIQIVNNKGDKMKLIGVNTRHMDEIEGIHIDRKEGENLPIVKVSRPTIRISINETVHGPENNGARSLRPVLIGHMPAELAPFTLLLEVFRIDYAKIMQRLQANTVKTIASTASSTTATSLTASSSIASSITTSSSTVSPLTPSSSSATSLTASSSTSTTSSQATPTAASSVTATTSIGSSSTASSSTATTSTKKSSIASSSKALPSVPITREKTRSKSSASKSNTAQKCFESKGNVKATKAKQLTPSENAPQIVPIAPNVVTMKAFRRLLMHRERLRELSKSSPISHTPQNVVSTNDSALEKPAASKPENAALPNNKGESNSFANTLDYGILSARFNSMFMWPLLLLTHEARSAEEGELRKEFAVGDFEKTFVSNQRSAAVNAVQREVGKGSNEQRNVLCNQNIYKDSLISTKMNDNKSIEKPNMSNNQQKQTKSIEKPNMSNIQQKQTKSIEKPNMSNNQQKQTNLRQLRRKRKKAFVESSEDSDESIDDSDFSDEDFSVGKQTGSGSSATNAASIGKESLRSRKRTR